MRYVAMKLFLSFSLALALASTACGSKSNSDTTPSGGAAGASGGSDVTQGEPAPAAPLGCDKEIAAVCGAGAEDGCLGGATTVHICVPADVQPGGPCSEEVMLNCASGQFDACTTNAATNHICVFEIPTE